MTICRYFLQGNCRFGNRCRFEHVYPNQHAYGGNSYGGGGGGGGGYYGGYRGSGNVSAGYNNNAGYSNSYNYSAGYGGGGGGGGGGTSDRGTSILRSKAATQYQNNMFGQAPPNASPYQPGFFTPSAAVTKSTPVQHDLKEIMQIIINELTTWEHSGQWPLSCFSVFKEQGCFPGLIDYSPEEIRWYMYQARAVGHLEECQQQIKVLYDKAKLVKEQLMSPNAEIVEILTRLSRGEKIETSAAPSFSDIPNASGNMFGASSGGNVISSQAASSFTFTLPNKPSDTMNQGFQGFGTPQTNVFTSPASNSVFSNVATHNPTQSIFGGSSQQVAQNMASPDTRNGFFNSHSNSQNINDAVTYTPMEEMTEEMVNAFNAPVYTMGSVPTKPPPKELCGL